MPSMKEITDRIARLKARMQAKAERIAEVEPKARAAVVDGKVLNGKLPELVGLRFEHDALADEVRRLEEQELPAAKREEAAKERSVMLRRAHKIHENRLATAARLDAALASAEEALASLVRSQAEGYGVAMEAAGHRQAAPHWSSMAGRAVWGQAPKLARHLGLSVALSHHGSPMARMLVGPPAEPDPLSMPGDAPVAENKLVPVGSKTPVLSGAKRMVSALLGPRTDYVPSGPDADRVAAKARKKADEKERNDKIRAAIARGEDVSGLTQAAPGPRPNTDNKRVPPCGDVPWSGEPHADAALAGAAERRAEKARKRLDAAMPVKDIHDVPPGAS